MSLYLCSYLPLFFFPHSFRMVPFLTELRAVMDWVWTDTTLSLSSWICVEDIYANIFILRCWRESEKVEHILYKCTVSLILKNTNAQWLYNYLMPELQVNHHLYDQRSQIDIYLKIHPLCIVDQYFPLSIPIEISSCSWTEKKQSGEIWYGWCDHFFPYLHCLVSSSLHVPGQISGWSNQSTIRCFHPT